MCCVGGRDARGISWSGVPGRVRHSAPAVLLARIRRLTELGLSLEEVRHVLAEDVGRQLSEALGELAADLARQGHEIQERRRVLAALLEGPLTAGS